MRRQHKEGKSLSSRSEQRGPKKNHELVWMQPNTISTNVQQKRQRASIGTKVTEDLTGNNNENAIFDTVASTGYQTPTSLPASGPRSSTKSPYGSLDLNEPDLMNSVDASLAQLERLISASSAQSQSRLQSPECPLELSSGDNHLCPDNSGTTDLLNDSLDFLLFQYQDGDILQDQLSLNGHGMSIAANTGSFDLQPRAQICE
jgi:hypothetical protein